MLNQRAVEQREQALKILRKGREGKGAAKAIRAGVEHEVDTALGEIQSRSEMRSGMAAGADRFAACLRSRDQVRGVPVRPNPFARSEEPAAADELSPAMKEALEEMGEQLVAGLAKLETKITEQKAAPARAASNKEWPHARQLHYVRNVAANMKEGDVHPLPFRFGV